MSDPERVDRLTAIHILRLLIEPELQPAPPEPEPDEAQIRAALDFGKTAEQHLVGGQP